MTSALSEAAAALVAIMALPDPPELQARGHRRTCEGRDGQGEIKAYLESCYWQHLLTAMEQGDVPKPRLS